MNDDERDVQDALGTLPIWVLWSGVKDDISAGCPLIGAFVEACNVEDAIAAYEKEFPDREVVYIAQFNKTTRKIMKRTAKTFLPGGVGLDQTEFEYE